MGFSRGPAAPTIPMRKVLTTDAWFQGQYCRVVRGGGSGDRLRSQSLTGCEGLGKRVTLSEHQMPCLSFLDELLAFMQGKESRYDEATKNNKEVGCGK